MDEEIRKAIEQTIEQHYITNKAENIASSSIKAHTFPISLEEQPVFLIRKPTATVINDR